jgi:voltage-gated potassium channel
MRGAVAGPAERGRVWRDVVMVALAFVSIAILVVEWQVDLSPERERQLLYLDLAIVAIFWIEYLGRLRAHKDRWAFVRANWYELPGMVPILPGMQGYGAVRLFRLLRILRILRLVGALRRFDRFERAFDRYVGGSKIGYVLLLATTVVFACATAAWLLEPETFTRFQDALWWAIVTATTVGYGDFFPRSGAGRLVGVVLMLLGVALIGAFAGTLSGFLVERRFTSPPSAPSPLPIPGQQLASELERLAELRRRGELTESEFQAAKRRLLD